MIGRLHHAILDCPDPASLARFYSGLLGLPVTYESDDFVVVSRDTTTSGLAFQLAPDHQPPRWRDPDHPQQIHFDVMVDDVAVAESLVLALGATPLAVEGLGHRTYADPAGHPFCLIPRPPWAPPISGAAGRRLRRYRPGDRVPDRSVGGVEGLRLSRRLVLAGAGAAATAGATAGLAGLAACGSSPAPKIDESALRRKVASLLVVGFRGQQVADDDWVMKAIRDGLGGVVLFDRDLKTGDARNITSPGQVTALVKQLR